MKNQDLREEQEGQTEDEEESIQLVNGLNQLCLKGIDTKPQFEQGVVGRYREEEDWLATEVQLMQGVEE